MSEASASAASPEAHEPSPSLSVHIFSAVAAALALVLVGVGGLPPLVTCAFGLLTAGVLAMTGWQQLRSHSHSWPVLPTVFAGLALYTLLQAVPLPMSMLRAISAPTADVWARALDPAVGAAPISLAPEMTLVEAIKWGAYAALAWVGYAWGRARGLDQAALLALGLGLLAAGSTALHGALHMTSVFGVYTPETLYPRWRMGPLLNANHLSGFLMLGAFGGLSRLISSREPPTGRTAIVLSATASLVLGVVLLASRAAVALLVVGALLLPVTLYQPTQKKRRSRQPQRRTGMALAAAVFVGGVALALYGFGDDVLVGLAERDVSKLKVMADASPMMRQFGRVGLGRGAFEGVFFAFKTISSYETWSNPENIVVQWVTEWGWPVALLGGAGVVFALARATSWRTSVTARVLLLSVLLVVTQNLVDFSLEVPAVAGLASFLLGVVTGAPGSTGTAEAARRRAEPKGPAPARLRASVALGWAALLAVLSLAGFARGPERLSTLRSAAYRIAQAPETTSIEPIVGYIRRFPGDPYLPLAAGIVASREAPVKGLPWFNRALERAPNLGAVHMALANTLARAGYRSQALLEVRIALERDPVGTSGAAALTARLARTAAEVISAAPGDSPKGIEFLREVASLMRDGSAAAGVRAYVLDRAPCTIALREQNVREVLNQMMQGKEPCIGPTGLASCRAIVEPEIARIGGCPDGAPLAQTLISDLMWAVGEREASLKLLEETCSNSTNDITQCLGLVAERASMLKEVETVRRAVRVVVSRRCQGADACSQAWSWAAGLHMRAGDHASAYVAATKATEIDPTNVSLKRQLAEAAMNIGARDKAEGILIALVARYPDDAAAKQLLAQVRATPPPPKAAPSGSGSAPSQPSPLLNRRPVGGGFDPTTLRR